MSPKTAAFYLCLSALVVSGCDLSMRDQPRYDPLQKSNFFEDGKAARPLVEGTVPRGSLKENDFYFTGKLDGVDSVEFPFPITEPVLRRGQERYNIYCSVCHDQRGFGQGMVVQRGFKQPTSFHAERLRAAAPGYFFNVMTNGFGAMNDYSAQITPHDRWAIAAYIKTLQYSQNADLSDLTDEERKQMADSLNEAPEKASGSTHANHAS